MNLGMTYDSYTIYDEESTLPTLKVLFLWYNTTSGGIWQFFFVVFCRFSRFEAHRQIPSTRITRPATTWMLVEQLNIFYYSIMVKTFELKIKTRGNLRLSI